MIISDVDTVIHYFKIYVNTSPISHRFTVFEGYSWNIRIREDGEIPYSTNNYFPPFKDFSGKSSEFTIVGSSIIFSNRTYLS